MNPDETATTPEQSTDTPSPAVAPPPLTASAPAGEAAQAGVTAKAHSISLRKLNAFYGDTHAVRDVDLDYAPNHVTAMIGPSGCGKSTLVRCINRMHEEIPGARSTGEVLLDDLDLQGNSVDVVSVRRAIGMVF